MELPADIIQFHAEIIEFGSAAQKISVQKKESKNHIGDNVFTVFSKVDVFGITLHRAVLTLCSGGWTHITPLLLRSLIECSANCLAMINNEFPDFMAFKYLYFPYIEEKRDENFPAELRESILSDLETGLKRIKDSRILLKAREFIETPNLPRYWFQPEEKSISSILKKYGGDEMLFVYGSLSMATHGYHFGIGLFKDDSDLLSIDPIDNPKRTRVAILFSCRHLLELICIRNDYERLGLESEYDALLKKIISFRKKE